MSLSTHCETYWSRIRRWILQILIISAVKVCKQHLQTASASRDFIPGPPKWTPLRPPTWTPLGDFCPQVFVGYFPQMKVPGATTPTMHCLRHLHKIPSITMSSLTLTAVQPQLHLNATIFKCQQQSQIIGELHQTLCLHKKLISKHVQQ